MGVPPDRLKRFFACLRFIRLVGAIFLEQNDNWAVERALYMMLETVNQISDNPLVSPVRFVSAPPDAFRKTTARDTISTCQDARSAPLTKLGPGRLPHQLLCNPLKIAV